MHIAQKNKSIVKKIPLGRPRVITNSPEAASNIHKIGSPMKSVESPPGRFVSADRGIKKKRPRKSHGNLNRKT